MIKKTVILILALALAFAASGCSLYEGEITDLFQPPRLGEAQQALLDALGSVAGSEYTLKHPHTGTNRSSVLFSDMDGDGEDEAAVFCVPSGMAAVQLHFFDSVDDKWVHVTEIDGDCAEVNRCEFADIDGDGAYELAVGWDILLSEAARASDTSSKGLSVYGFDEGGYKQIFSAPYSYMLKENLNSDPADEIAIVSTSLPAEDAEGTPTTRISVIENRSGVISADRSVELYGGVSSYFSITSGMIGDGEFAVLLDAKLTSGEYVTQIIKFNTDEPHHLFPTLEDNPTKRSTAISCMDIDNDTYIEFPICSPLPDYDESSATVRYLTDWCTFENGVFTTDVSAIVSVSYGFYINVYPQLRGLITVEVNPEDALFTVRTANGSLTGDPLFAIKRFSADDGASAAAEGYTILFKSGGYMITAKIFEDSFNGIALNKDEIIKIVNPLSAS